MINLTTLKRFMSKVDDKPNKNNCWLWTGSTINGKPHRYGNMRLNGKMQMATKTSYELFIGLVPKGALLCHRCDITLCVNPAHLFIGSQSDNMNDMHRKKRHNAKSDNLYLYKGELKNVTQIAIAENVNRGRLRHYLTMNYQTKSKLSLDGAIIKARNAKTRTKLLTSEVKK